MPHERARGSPRVADTRDAACARIAPLLIPVDHYADAALAAGMLSDDFAALRTTIDGLNHAVTFRDSNQACARASSPRVMTS